MKRPTIKQVEEQISERRIREIRKTNNELQIGICQRWLLDHGFKWSCN